MRRIVPCLHASCIAAIVILAACSSDAGPPGNDLAGAPDDLSASGDDLSASGDDLSGSSDDLSGTSDDLSSSGNDLSTSGADMAMTDASGRPLDAALPDLAIVRPDMAVNMGCGNGTSFCQSGSCKVCIVQGDSCTTNSCNGDVACGPTKCGLGTHCDATGNVCVADPEGKPGIRCGLSTCKSTEYCVGSNGTFTCQPITGTCATNPTCACLESSVGSIAVCKGNTLCQVDRAGTINCNKP